MDKVEKIKKDKKVGFYDDGKEKEADHEEEITNNTSAARENRKLG